MSISTERKNAMGDHRERAKLALDDAVSSTEDLVKCISGGLVSSLSDLDDELKAIRDTFKLIDSCKRLLVEIVTVNLDMAKEIDDLKESVDKLEETTHLEERGFKTKK